MLQALRKNALVAFAFFSLAAAGEDLARVLEPFGISSPSSHFKILNQSLQKSGDRQIQTLRLQGMDSEASLVITGPLTAEQFANYLRIETVSFQRLYTSAITPYPDKISDRTSCPKNLRPQESNERFLSQKVTVWFAKASARKAFGVCSRSEAVYDGALALVHLKSGYAVKLMVFTKAASTNPVNRAHFKKLAAAFSLQ